MSLSLLFVFHVVTPSAGGSSLTKHTKEETTTSIITIEHGYHPLDKIICKLSPEEELVTPFNRQQLCSEWYSCDLVFGGTVVVWYCLRRVEILCVVQFWSGVWYSCDLVWLGGTVVVWYCAELSVCGDQL